MCQYIDMVTNDQISSHYKTYKPFIQWFFYKSGASFRSEEMANDVYAAIVRSQSTIDDLNKYAWGCVRNKLKMLYRSADYKATKCQYIDNGVQISQSYDMDAFCELMDNNQQP